MRLTRVKRFVAAFLTVFVLAFGFRALPAEALMCYSFFDAEAWYDDGTPDGVYVGYFVVECFDDGDPDPDGPVWV
jgi:hypothetical protein